MSASTERKLRQAAREAGTDKKMLAKQEEAKKAAKSKRRWTLGTVIAVLLIAAVLLLNSGLLYKTTALTVNGEAYSASEMNYHYASQYYYLLNQYGNYISMLGLDTSGGLNGLDKQECSLMEGSWRDYLLNKATEDVKHVKFLCEYAEENGITLDENDLADIDANFADMDSYAKLQGYASADKFFGANYGEGVTTKLIRKVYTDTALSAKALTALTDSYQYSAEELKARYDSYEGAQDLYDYVYYFVAAETTEINNEDGTTTYEISDDQLAEAKAKAEAVYDGFMSSEGSDYAARMDAAVSAVIPGSTAYVQSNVKGSNLGDYGEWLSAAGRTAGDAVCMPSSAGSGYYIVVFVNHNDNNYNMASVRHILVKAEASEDGTYTQEAKDAAKARAEEILAEFNAGDKSEESFAALAEQYSEDAGSNTNGGLYENITKGQMVQQFNDFCFAEHKSGDTGIVYGESSGYAGYHVMYYVGEGMNYRDYIAKNDLSSAALDDWFAAREDAAAVSTGFGMRFVG